MSSAAVRDWGGDMGGKGAAENPVGLVLHQLVPKRTDDGRLGGALEEARDTGADGLALRRGVGAAAGPNRPQ